tara:strand:- start:3453 stop:3641 length:189 start_codon:yes stop_codon:yes gene_type:complete
MKYFAWETDLDHAKRPTIEELQVASNRARHTVKMAREKLKIAEQKLDRVAMAYSIEMMRGVK